MTDFLLSQIHSLTTIIGFFILSCAISFAWAPALIKFLYKFKITRKDERDPTMSMESRKDKINTPIMGGLLVIVTVAVITIALNWERRFTWVPIGVMLLAALLGGVDDMLNTFGQERRSRSLSQTLTLIRVHKSMWVRVWLFITLPWATFKRLVMRFGSKPGKGVHVHEKLLLQFLAGAISAWWIYWKLGDTWQLLYIPFFSFVDIGILIVPLIILVVMFTANAVNISDGMDGLAGGMLIPTFGALAFLSWVSGYDNLAILNATTAGALLTYTYFNIKPARFQMGDVGSLGLGALLAINALATNKMAVLILLAFVFYIEAFSVIIQVLGRYFLGKRIFRMAPLHHHFELKGWSEEKTIMRFWVIHCFFVVVGVWVGLH
jgi:phospho-N-acetylmuramoyl-pentapeptide-transferase